MRDAPDMTGAIYSQYLQAHRSAIEAEKKGSTKKAAEEYAKAAK